MTHLSLRRVLAVILAFAMLATGLIVLDGGASADTTYYINDNFDDGTVQGWYISQAGGTLAASTDICVSEPYSLKFNNVHIKKAFTQQVYEGSFNFWTPDNFQFLTMDSTTDTGLDIKCVGGNFQYYNGAAWTTLGPCSASEWHKVTFKVNNQHLNLTLDETSYSNLTGTWTGNAITALKFTAGVGSTYIDNMVIADDIPDGPLEWLTTPWLTAIVGQSYAYDASCSWSNVTYQFTTEATFLSVSDTGLLSGTPTADDIGTYHVNLTAMAGSLMISQNFELKVYSPIALTESAYSEYSNFWLDEDDGVMYHTYLDSANDVMVTRCVNGVWETPVRVDDNHADIVHGISSIIQSDDGYLHVFYGCHETPMYYAKSSMPNDISSWTVESTSFSNSATYPWLFKQNDGTMLNVYRVTVSSGENYRWVYRSSTDNGTTWGSAVTIIQYGAGYAPYPAWYFDPDTNRLWCTMDIYLYGSSTYKGLYVLNYDFDTGHVYDVDGTDYGPIHDVGEQAATLEYASPETVCIGIMTVDDDGYPCVISFDSEFAFMRWNGTAWSARESIMSAGARLYMDAQIYYNASSDSFTALLDLTGPLYKYTRLANGTWECDGELLAPEQTKVSSSMWRISNRVQDDRWYAISEYKQDESPVQSHYIAMYDAQLGQFVNTDYTALDQGTPEVSSTPVTTGKVGVAYQYQVVATAGVSSWTITAPSFLFMSESGLVTGTPDAAGTYSVTINAYTVHGQASQTFDLVISPPTTWAITSAPVTTGMVGLAYSYAPICNGTATTWTLSGNATFLEIDPSTGIVTGAPTAAGTYTVTISANTDPACNQTYELVVSPLEWEETIMVKTVTSGLKVSVSYTLSDPSLAWAVKSVSWNFGDGSMAQVGSTATHTYARAGTYTVTCTVVNVLDNETAGAKSVSVKAASSNPPTTVIDGGDSSDTSKGTSSSGMIFILIVTVLALLMLFLISGNRKKSRRRRR